jgi:hypothetical protein
LKEKYDEIIREEEGQRRKIRSEPFGEYTSTLQFVGAGVVVSQDNLLEHVDSIPTCNRSTQHDARSVN